METEPATPTRAPPGVRPPGHDRGLVTLLFSDVVGSTALKQTLGDRAGVALLKQHHEQIRQVLRDFAEVEVIKTAGDSFLILFPMPSEAVKCALLLQGRLRQFNQGLSVAVQDRLGLHMGEVVIEEIAPGQRDVHGMQVDTCSRVMGLAQGGQILMTRGVFDSARQMLKGEDIEGVAALNWVSHGRYLLKGVEEPVEICEVAEAGRSPLRPPDTTEKAQRHSTPDEEPVLGWRPAVGQQVARTDWVLEEKLGEGGFGEVWLGRHRKLKDRRVFKFCFRADRIRSLKRELTLFRLLKERIGEHPNIVRLHEVYFDEPPYFLEEDYVEGRDLAHWCEAQGGVKAVPLETRLEIVAQVADALQAAHECGVIHRDVKPGNILVAADGSRRLQSSALAPAGGSAGESAALSRAQLRVQVKLTDFGIGQVVSQEYLAGVTRAGFTQTLLPSSSSHAGTQLYLAPELLAGEPATTRSDTYSLGVVLYQLLAGAFNRPLTSDWTKEVADPLLRDDLRHCVAGKPADRFVGAGQLATNLRAYRQRQEERVRKQAEAAERERLRQQSEHRHRLLVAAAAVTLVLTAIAVALGYGFNRAEQQRRRAEAYLYDADMNFAGQALQQHDLGRALNFLNFHRPGKAGQRDLRGWEWRYLWEQCRSDELATIGQHDGLVQAVGLSPDGKWVASGGYDGLLKIWALDSGAAGGPWVTNLQLGGGPVSSVAFSPDGRWLAALTWTNGFALLRAPGWQREMTVTNTEKGYAGSLAFSADSRLLAVRGEVWSLDTRARLRTLPCTTYSFGHPAVAWLPNSHTLAGFGMSNGLYRVSLFDVSSTNQDATVSVIPLRAGLGEPFSPATLAFSPDGSHLAVGCLDGTICIHAANDWRQVKMLTNHTAWVSSLAFSKDGQWLASASFDHSIKVWRTRDWRETATLHGHLDEVWAVAFTPDGQRLVSGSKDYSVRLWPLAGRSRPIAEADTSAGDTTWWGLSGACPFRVGPSNILTVWDGQTLQVRQRLSSYPVANVLFSVPSPDGRLILMATAEGALWLTDLAPGAASAPVCLQTNGSPLQDAAFSDQAEWLAVADGQALRVWNLKNQPRRPGFVLAAENFRNLRFSHGERLLGAIMPGAIFPEQTVVVWDVASGKKLVRLQPPRDYLSELDFSPDGTVLATICANNTCKLFDLRRRQDITTLRGQLLSLHSVCFSPDGRRLATVSNGSGPAGASLIIWDLETSREVLVLKTGWNISIIAGAVRFHPSGDSLLLFGAHTLRLYRAPSWEEIAAAEKSTKSKTQ